MSPTAQHHQPWKNPQKHEEEKKKKEPESTEIKIGKQMKVFISNLEYLKHHSLLSPAVNEGTGKVSCLCQKMETWELPWTVLWPAGPETADTSLSSGPDPAANKYCLILAKTPNHWWTWTFFWQASLPQTPSRHLQPLQSSVLSSKVLSSLV